MEVMHIPIAPTHLITYVGNITNDGSSHDSLEAEIFI